MSVSAQIWTRFTKIRDGKELKLRIQELPQDKLGNVFEFMGTHLFPEEPLHKASKVAQRAEALVEYKQLRTAMMLAKPEEYQVDACCLDDSSELQLQIVGLSIMILEKKDHLENLVSIQTMAQAREIRTVLSLAAYMNTKCNIFETYNVDILFKGRGLAVHKDYRRLGIAEELLHIRSAICKERGVPLTSAWMTSIGSQKAAAKLGWETIYEMQNKDLGTFPGIDIEDQCSSCKLMAIKL